MPRRLNLTASMLRAYKSCPRLYELQYVEMLKPAQSAEYLETGSNYHACIESILKGEPYQADGLVADMAHGFERHVPYRDWNIVTVEHEFKISLTPFLSMVGKIDAICADGTPVEHKTTGAAVSEKYADHLAWDDQISFYLLALSLIRNEPVTKVIYTVCPKTTIKLNKNEAEEAFQLRRREWYTADKIQVFTAVRSEAELQETEGEIREIAREIRRRKHFYRNPSHCGMISCAYASICLNYDPEITTGFVKKERMSEELCKF